MSKMIARKARLMAKIITGPITGRISGKKTQTATEYLNNGTVSALSTEIEHDTEALVSKEAVHQYVASIEKAKVMNDAELDRRAKLYGTMYGTPPTLNPNAIFRARKLTKPMTAVGYIENADRIGRLPAMRHQKELKDIGSLVPGDPKKGMIWSTKTGEWVEDNDPLSEDDSLWDADEFDGFSELMDDVEDED